MEDQPRTLKSVFADAEAKREALGSTSGASPSYREALAGVIKDYEECLELMSRLGIFSPNESADDIATSDLPFLLANYFLAEGIEKTPIPSPAERIRTLKSVRATYERFLHQLDNYDLLSAAQARLLERYTADPEHFSTLSTSNPEARRNSKIANAKTERDLRARVAELRRQRHDPDGDDETARQIYLAQVAYYAHMAFQALEGVNLETEVLAQAGAPLAPPGTSAEPPPARDSEYVAGRLDRPLLRSQGAATGGPLLSKTGKPLQPFTILGNRAEMAKQVFRPGHNLPTMSIDEYLDEEMRRGGIIEGGGEASLRQPEPDEDNVEKADAETMKARAWDEFKEANSRGSGNTMNRG